MSDLDEISSFKNRSNLRLNYSLFMSKILVRTSIIFKYECQSYRNILLWSQKISAVQNTISQSIND